MKYLLTLAFCLTVSASFAQKTIEFKAADGLTITADLYEKSGSKKVIVLFHQAGWSRGEYKEIAPKLNEMGYTCLAVDQRSGGGVNDVKNETNARAKKAGKKTSYADAFQDIEAAVSYAKSQLRPDQLIIWGSSYSSALVLKYAGDYPNNIDAVLSFSPGEYFGSKNFISSSAKNIKAPSFITSAKNEKGSWWGIHQSIPEGKKKFFLPDTKGNHGSRALWNKFDDSSDYWAEVRGFLKSI